MSRVTEGYRGSGSIAHVADRRQRFDGVQIDLGDVHGIGAGSPWALGHSAASWPRTPTRVPPVTRAAADRPGASHGSRMRRRVDRRAMRASQTRSTTPLMSKKSTSRAAPLQWLGAGGAGPGARQRAPLAGGSRESRADLEQPDVALLAAPVVRHGVDQARKRRRPQHREVFRQRVGDGHDIARRPRTRAAAVSPMNPNVTASREPGAGQDRAQVTRLRRCAGRSAAARRSATGNVTGSRSKP